MLFQMCRNVEIIRNTTYGKTKYAVIYTWLTMPNIYEKFVVKFYAKKDRTDYDYYLKVGRCNDEEFDNYSCENKDNDKKIDLTTNFQWYEIELPVGKNSQPAIYMQAVPDNISVDASGIFNIYIDKIIIVIYKTGV